MSTQWTKADLRRIARTFDSWRLETGPGELTRRDAPDETLARWNAATAEHAAEIVCVGLRVAHRGLSDAENRARAKLAERIARDGLPADVEIPRLTLMSEIREQVAAEQRAARERVEALALAEAERRKPKPRDLAGVLEHLRFNVAHEIAEGRVRVAHVEGQPFGDPDFTWAELSPIAWADWLRPTARADVDDAKWAMATNGSEASERFVPSLTQLWTKALAERELPDIIDLSTAPTFHGTLRDEWVKPLAAALRKRERGIVILVRANADIHARVLPSYVGGS